MKTQLSNSILTVSLTSLLCGACGTPEELSVPVASQENALTGTERALSSPVPAGKRHCVATATAKGKESPASLGAGRAEPAPAACFETFAEAVSFATRGRVQLPADTVPEGITAEQLMMPSSPYVIGVEYTNKDFGGRSLVVSSDVDCSATDLFLNPMPTEWPYEWPFGWNDVVSSARAFSGCNHSYHYEDIYFGGAVVDCQTECSYIGAALNNRTSSIKWTQ